MGESRSEVVAESRRKGLVAGATVAAAVTLGVVVAPTLGAIVAIPAAVLGYRWWKHRAASGIRF
jgi:uncharacterized membrane protein